MCVCVFMRIQCASFSSLCFHFARVLGLACVVVVVVARVIVSNSFFIQSLPRVPPGRVRCCRFWLAGYRRAFLQPILRLARAFFVLF